MNRTITAAIWGMMMVAIATPISSAQPRPAMRNQPGVGGVVNLPYVINDANGGIWRIYQGGWMQQQGNMPAYSQGAMLMINGQQAGQNSNQAKLDEKTGELVLSDVNGNGLVVERRILFDKTNSFVRYIDVLRNPQNQPQTFNVMIQSSTNYGINAAQYVPDPKKKEQNIGWVAQTGAGVAVVEVFAGHNSKVVPNMSWPQGNNFVQASFSLAIAGGKEVAIMHLHRVAASADAGVQFISGLKDNVLLKSIPAALR
ncbi:MAG TPA: hypothetical protein VH370_22685, partial [Humisphaera sp.]|nr:hypothetical protein [Humisphaera sp.]